MFARVFGARPRRLGLVALCTAFLGVGFAAGVAVAAQGHMQAALSYLQSARGELQVAESNKAGHRVNALKLVNQAIAETQAGIAAGM